MSDDVNDGQMIFGDLGGLKLPDNCLRKNLTQETCPDRGPNLGPLHDRHVCYHLAHRWTPGSQIHSPQLHVAAPGIFSDLIRYVQMLKKEWVQKATGIYRIYLYLVKQ